MAILSETWKIWHQADLSATTWDYATAIPNSTWAEVWIQLCERGSAAGTYRVALRNAGAALADDHYVRYDVVLAALGVPEIGPFMVGPKTIIGVYSANADVSVTIHGKFKLKAADIISP